MHLFLYNINFNGLYFQLLDNSIIGKQSYFNIFLDKSFMLYYWQSLVKLKLILKILNLLHFAYLLKSLLIT